MNIFFIIICSICASIRTIYILSFDKYTPDRTLNFSIFIEGILFGQMFCSIIFSKDFLDLYYLIWYGINLLLIIKIKREWIYFDKRFAKKYGKLYSKQFYEIIKKEKEMINKISKFNTIIDKEINKINCNNINTLNKRKKKLFYSIMIKEKEEYLFFCEEFSEYVNKFNKLTIKTLKLKKEREKEFLKISNKVKKYVESNCKMS